MIQVVTLPEIDREMDNAAAVGRMVRDATENYILFRRVCLENLLNPDVEDVLAELLILQ